MPQPRPKRPRGVLSRASLMVAAALLGMGTSPQVKAANLYWDNNTSVAGTGGSGSWSDDKSSNWSVSSVGDAAAAAGTFSSADIAYFTGTAGTATLAGPITIGGLVFSGADFTVTGDTLTLAADSGAPTISVTNGNIATLSSIVAGTSGLTKSGNGVLKLTNASNSYTGITTLSAGSLVITSGDALGDATSAISILTTNLVPSSTNLYSFGAGSLVLDGSATGFNLGRDINFDGRGPIGERGSAILSIGDNTLSGILTSAVNALSPATPRNSRINSVNGTLTLSGTLLSQGTAATTFLNLGGVNTAGVGNFNLTGILSGSGSIEKSGAGILFLSPSTVSGFTGTVRVGGSAIGQQSSVRVTQATVGGVSVFGANAGTNASAAIDMNGGVLELLSAGDLNFNALPGGKNVYLRASSTFFTGPAVGGATINGLATFGTFRVAANTTGTFNSRNGYGMTFQAWSQESTNNNNTITNSMGGTLTFAAGVWGNNDGSVRTLTFGGNGNTVVVGNITATVSAHVVTKSGTGLLTITSTGSTFTGATNITAGAIQITDFRSLGTTSSILLGVTTTAGNLIIGSSVTASIAGLTTSLPITLNTTTGGNNSIYANQTLASPVILNGAITKLATTTAPSLILGGTSTQDNIINVAIPVGTAGTGGVTKLGVGTWVLNAINTYTGATTIQAGTLKLRATAGASDVIKGGAVVFSADTVTQTAGGTLEFKGFLSTATTETLGALTPTTGMGNVSVVSNGALTTLTFASMGTRAAGTGLNFTNPTSGSIVFTAAVAGTNGIVGGFATVGGVNFVSSITAGGAVAAPSYTAGGAQFDSTIPVTVGSATKNYFSNGSAATTGNFAANSLKLTNNGSGGAFTGTGVLTITAASATSLGGILFDNSGGAGSISGYTGITLSTLATEYIFTVGGSQSGNALTVSSPLTAGAASFTKNGPGVLVLSGTSVFTGDARINEGTVKLSGGTVTFGTNSTVANITTLRQGATLDINAAGASQTIGVGALQGAGTVTNSGGVSATTAGTISFGRSTSTGTTIFSGILQNGSGVLNVTIDGTAARTQSLLGLSTYTGVTTIATGAQVTVDVLAAGGSASGIGASTNAAANLVFNGTAPTLVYQGNNRVGSLNLGSNSATTDRLFTISGAGAVLSSTVSNNNAIVWSNTGAIVHGTVAARTLTLTGASTGDNTFNPQLTDSGTGAAITSLIKTAAGQWNLGSSSNSYTGATTVNEGILGLNAVAALPANSPLALTPTSATSVAILQMSGEFTRSLALSAEAGSGTFTFGYSIASTTGGAGFAAHSTPLIVAIGGTSSPTALTWGSGGFIGTGGIQNLALGSTTALSSVDFRNAINLGASVRTINVLENVNTGADYASMSGALSGAGGGILKIGAGPLRLTALNSYTGTTSVEAGTLVVSSLGGSTGAATTSVGAGAVAMGNLNAIVLGNATTGAGLLQYVGPGETSDRKIRLRGTTAASQIHADGSGSLVLTNVAHDTTETGSKTLNLRGNSPYVNFITSQLSDNGATAMLSVTVDGGTAWVLTNSANNYTGTTTVGGGALGIGHNSAIPATLTISNGNVFAYGADRALSVTLNLGNNAASGFYGDYSLTFNGTNNVAAAANNLSTYNSVVAGKSVTFNGLAANSLTALRAWALEGSGETVINGNFTTTTAFGVRIDKGGDGTLVLGTSGATSNWNQTSTAVDLDRGTLKFSANNAIPSFGAATPTGSAAATSTAYTVSSTAGLTVGQQFTGTNVPAGSRITSIDGSTTFTASLPTAATPVASGTVLTFVDSGGLIISPEVATTDTATVDLNGTTQTINALTASTDGTVIINNTSSSAAAFRFGAKDTAVAFGTGIGNYSIQNTGSGKLDIIKAGNSVVSFGASVPLGNKGIIASEGGSFTVAGDVTAASGLSATGNSTLALTGTLTNPGLITSMVVSGGSTLSLLNGAGSAINLNLLNLGAGSGTASLNLNVGESATDTITLLTGGTKTLANTITFNVTDAGLAGTTTYTLLSLVDGGLTAFGGSTNLLAGGTPGGFTTMTWGFTDTAVTLTTGTLITGDLYWRGATGTTWNTDLNNWSTDKAGTITPVSSPGAGTNVIFAWNGAAASALTTTLEQNFKINKLVFEEGTTTPTEVTINPGAVATNRLEIAPQLAADGIVMQSTGPAIVTIGANLRLGANQTWNVASSSGVLTVAGSLLGGANVTKSGAGKVILSAAADPGFNPAGTTTFTVAGGTLELTNAGALGTAAAGNLASLVLSGGAFYYNGAAGTVSNILTLAGGTLSAGTAAQTYSGAITAQSSTTSTINQRDLNSATTSTTSRAITLSGLLSGTGAITLDSVDTASSGNQLTGNLTFNNGSSTWSGALNLTRGTAYFQNLASNGTATPYYAFPGIINFNQFGRVVYRNVDGAAFTRSTAVNFAASAVGELQVDNRGGLAANYTLTQSGTVNLNAGSIARFSLDDAASNIIFSGGVVLNGNASISVLGGDADSLVTISGIGITGTGNLAINDEAGGWTITSGRLAINAAGTYIGNTTLTEGTLIIGHKDALSSGSLTILGTSTLQPSIDLSGASAFPNATVLSAGTLTIAGSNNFTFGALLSPVGGNRTLTNSLTSPAALLITSLNLAETGTAASRTLTIAGTGTTTITSLVNNDHNNTLTNSQTTVTLGVGTIALSETSTTGRTLTLDGTGNTTVTGVISNFNGVGGTAGILAKAGAGTLQLDSANTYSGGTTLSAGTLRLGNKDALGSGTLTVSGTSTIQASTVLTGANAVTNALALNASLTFSGNNSLQLSGAVNLGATARSLTASGAAGATLTLSGAISNLATADGSALNLSGNATGTGVISGGFTITGDVADAAINGGSWIHSGGTSRVGDDLTLSAGASFSITGGRLDVRDDFVVTGASTVLNLNATGVLSFNTATLSVDASLTIRDGAQVNLGANNAVVATEFDRLFVGQDADGLKPTLNMGAFNLTTSRLIVGERATTRIGDIIGTGTLTVTGGDIDLFKGLIAANLGSTGTTALEKFGSGVVTFAGDNSALASTGASGVYEGELVLDYSSNNATKLRSSSVLDMRGAVLTLLGNASAATAQTVNGLTLANGGSNRITLTPGAGQDILLTLGAITRAASAGTLRVVLPSGTQSATNGVITSSTVTNGTLPGYLTVSDGTGTYFATKNDTNNLIAITSTTKTDVSTWSGIDNVDNVGGAFSGTFAASGSINSLTFASATSSTVTIASGATLNILSGGVLMTSAVTSGTHTITGGRLTSGIADLVFTQDGAATLDVSSVIGSNNAITKTGNGILRLTNAANTFTGAVNVQAGVLQAAGGNSVGDTATITLADDRASTFQLLADETIGNITGGSVSTNSIYGIVALGSNNLTIGLTAGTYAGVFTGSGTITRNGTSGLGNLSLTGASGSGFTGALVVNGGLLMMEGAATLDAASLTVNKGGAFLISNNGATRSSARLPDAMPVFLNSADGSSSGSTTNSGLWIRTDTNATTNETIGVLTLATGASYFRGDAGGTTGIAGIITSNFVRQNNSTLAARGRNLGATTGDRNFLRIATGTANETAFAATLVGGAGAATTKTISIVPWIIGETQNASVSDATMGNSLVTYVVSASTGAGLRPLALATEYNTFLTNAGATDNIRESLTASVTGLASTTINALVVNNANTTAGSLSVSGTGAGQTLAVTSGAMLFTATGAITGTPAMGITLDGFDGGITVGSTNEYVVFVQNPTSAVAGGLVTATIGSSLTSTADVTKSGRGTLVLSVANTAGGNTKKTTLNEGILHIDALDKIGGTTGGLVFAGGTLKFGGVFDPSTRTISFLQGGGTFDTNGNDIALANSLGSGTGSFTKTGNGTLTLNAASTYTGATNVSGGTLALGANDLTFGTLTVTAAATLAMGANNATVSTLTLSAGSANVISGSGTLTVTGDATLNQGSIAPILAGAMNLFKSTGSQTVTLSNAANTYTGFTYVQAGILEITNVANAGTASSLGAPTGENSIIRIGNGTTTGTLLIAAAGTAGTTDRVISLDGSTGGGVIDNDGTAALILNGAIRGGEAGAKTVTIQGATTGFNNVVGGVISDGLGTLSLAKDEAGTWILLGANTYTGTTTVSAGVLQVGNGSTTGSLGTGAVAIASGASLVLNRSDAFAVANVFSGLGTLTVTGGNTYTLTGASTLTGGVIFSGSDITLGASQALGSLSGSSGNLALGSNVLTLSFATGTSTYSGNISGTGSIIKSLAGTQVLTGTNDFSGGITVTGGLISVSEDAKLGATSGPLVLNGGGLQVTGTTFTSWTDSSARTLTLSGATTFDIADQANTFTLGVSAITAAGAFTKSGLGRLEVTNALTMGAHAFNVNAGTLVLQNGLTNATGGTFGVGGVANANAAFVQTGGTSLLGQADADTIQVGNGGNAFGSFTISGGTFQATRLQPGGTVGTNNSGLISVLNGGTLKLTNYFIGGRQNSTNTGVVTIAGGTLDLTAIGAVNSGAYGGGRFEVNLGANLGGANTGGTFDAGAKMLYAVTNATTSQGIINLLGGTLTVGSVSSLASSTFAQFNMNGGTLKAGAASATFLNSNLTAANVYSGGVTIDNNGFAITLAKSLTAPAGNGVASVSVTGASGYFTAPMVKLTGGGGNGDATAVAVLNGDGTISVVITNPGTGYTSEPTVTLVGGTSGSAATASAVLNSGNTSGGITFQGSSTTTLSGANTYTGGTTVNVGTLALGANNVLADAGNVTIAGGTLNIATFNDTVATVSLESGVITGSTGVLTSTSAYDLRNGSVSAILGGTVGLNKTTADTVTLSKANTYSGVTSVTGGTLAFSAANNLGDASATNTLTLNGGTLSYTGSGSAILVANQVMTVGSSSATLNASDVAGTLNLQGGIVTSAAANLTKTGLGAVSVSGSTNLNGGNVTVSAGALNLGFTATGAGALTVAADATLNLYDGAATTMAISGLTLAAGSSLGFDLGSTGVNDVLSLTGTAAITPSVSLNFNALGSLGAGSYSLLSVSTGTLNAADYVLGLAPSGLNYNFTTINSGQTLQLTTSLLSLVYWKGDVSGSWSANNAGDTNWVSDLAGSTDLGALPSATDTLVFSSSGATGPTFTTTLDGNFTADSLKFTANPIGVTAVAVNQGSSGTLTLSPASANNGISVPADAGAITIGAPLATGAIQTWEVVGGGTNGSSLTVSGAVTIGHIITKTGAGVLTLSGSNTGSGGLVLAAGTLIIGNDSALGAATFSIGAGTTVNTGAAAIVNAGNNVQNWNGNFTFTGTNTLNLGTGAVTLGENVVATISGQTLTVGGAIGDGAATFGLTKSGAGALTLNGTNTSGGGVTLAAGTLNIGDANALGSGTLTLNGGSLDNTSGGTLTLGGNIAQTWNAGFAFTGTNNLVMGSGVVTLAANIPVNVTAGNLTVNGVIDDGLNTFNLEKTGAGTLTLGALNTYGGATTIGDGTLAFTANQTLAAATNTLLFGATAASTTPGNLVLTADATFGGALIVNTNSATASQITIGSGKTLTFNANVQIGATAPTVNGTVTKLTLNGGGVFNVTTAAAGTFTVGGSTAAFSQDTTLDLTALASTTINTSPTGTLRVNPSSGTNIVGAKATLLLPAPVVADTVATATVTAGTIAVGNAGQFSSQAGQINTISLGTGLTTLNANTLNVGTGTRDIGQIIYGQAGGDLKIRAADGTSRATLIAIGVAPATTATSEDTTNNLVDFSSHDADILVTTLNVGNQARVGHLISEFKFGAGDSSLASVLDVINVNIGFRTGTTTATNILTNRVNISGGAVTFGDGAGAGTGVKVGSSTYNQAGVASTIGELNISGGTVLINNSTALAAAVQLGDNASAGGGTVTASMNLTGGTTTLGGHIIRSASSLRTTSTVTLDGAGAILDMDGNNIGSASALITFNAQAGTLRNLAQLNGGGVLTKSTAGVLLLDTANSFTGGLTIAANGGTVIAGHNNALGTGTVTLGGNAAQLTLVDGITVANTLFLTNSGGLQARTLRLQTGATSATYAGPISNSSSSTTTPSLTFSAEASGTLIISGIISGLSGRGVSKTGAGTVSLTGANSYTGSTTITTGTLTAATGSLAGTSGIIVNGAVLSAVNYNLAATLALNASATATISAADLNVSGAVTNANATDANALNFSASTGTITLASLAGAGKTTFGSAATITGGISVGVVNVTGLLTAAVTGGTVNAGSMTGAVSSSVTVSGLLTGAITAGTNALGSLSSTSVTGGTNTITGAATVALVNGGTTTVGGVAAITTLTTGTLNLNGATSSIGTLTAGTVNLGTTALTVNDGTFGGLLAGATGSLIKASSGTLTLSAANTYGGGTTVNLGTLIVGNAGALGTGAVTVNGGTLDLNTTNIAQVTNVITVTSGSVIGGTTTASVNTAGSPPAVTAVLTGAGGLTKTDAGTLTITTANFHTGATVANVAGAVIRASHLSDTSSSLGASALDVPANLVLGLGAKLEFTGGTATSTTRSFTVGGTAGIVAGTGAGTLEFTSASKLATTGDNPELTLTANNAAAGSNRFDGILASGSNPLAVLAIDGTGTWVIGGNANRFKGDIRIDAGAGATLGFESGSLGMGSGYTSSVIRLNNNTVLVWSGANTDDISSRIQIPTGAIAKMNLGSNNVEFASAPKDATGAALTAGTIQKSGTGTLKIATAVSSPGLDFDVPAGKLTINGTVGNVTLAAGSTLGGEGTVGAVTAASGSIISPGNSPGILFAESMTLAGPSTFLWEVQDALAGPGVGGYDKMVISGSLDLTGASAGNKITLKINSLTADGVTIGNATNFGPPNGNSSLRTFQFASVQTGANGVSLGNGLNISDVFQFDVTDFRYTGGGLSNASLWSIDWNSGTGAITLTAVPEPSTYGFGLGALALAAAAIRRRRKTQAKA